MKLGARHLLLSNIVDGMGHARWFAVHTQPNRELRATTQLLNQGYQVFVPKRMKTVRHARRLKTIIAPLFPRYVFIELDLTAHQWRNVNSTFGVTSLVMQGDMPHPVPQGIVETMIASVDGKGLVQFEQDLKVGGRVRLAAGPFADRLGILDRLDDSGRVRVLLEIMGGRVPVRVPREIVMAA